ncbi:MAG: hypothetical protein RIC87_04515 [Kiloniellales bacterium]
MQSLETRAILELWESGRGRHPLDRALLLADLAGSEIGQQLAPERLSELPLGMINRRLLRLRQSLFGAGLTSMVRCPACQETIEVSLQLADLLAVPERDETRALRLEEQGHVFRPPSLKDLAALLTVPERDDGGLALLRLCCLDGEPEAETAAALLEPVGRAMEVLDPLADLDIRLTCGACGAASSATLDIGRFLWAEIETEAKTLLREVDAIARVYGWGEAEILALSPARRRSYLDLVLA